MKSLLNQVLVGIILSTAVVVRCASSPISKDRILSMLFKIHRKPNRKGHENIFDVILKANSKRRFGFFPGKSALGRSSIENEELFQGDIVMTNDIRNALKTSGTDMMYLPWKKSRGRGRGHRGKRGVTASAERKWSIVNGRVDIPYVIESSIPDSTVIIQAMNHWSDKVPCIKFLPRTSQADYISFFSGQGCYSYVGHSSGRQRISIDPECSVKMGVVAHEIGHALGFWHEQSRPDRDKYVKILWSNIQSGKEEEFIKVTSDSGGTDDLGVAYDLASLMHYGPNAFAKASGLNTIESLDGSTDFGQLNSLSDKDIEQARLLYCPGTDACQTLYTDSNKDCEGWAALGFCQHSDYKASMSTTCKKSCVCQGS